jgi:diacylglycerol kinase (ATP)
MKFAKLLHNPGAGEGDFSKKELVSMVQSAGFGCSYSSTKKKGWEKIESKEIDFIILAGGDGTVRRVADSLLHKTLLDRKLPVALLPMGTANNIAKTIGVPRASPEEVIKSWKKMRIIEFDVGRIFGVSKAKFFLESFGFGIMPSLMSKMQKIEQDSGNETTREESISTALEIVRDLIMTAPAKYCKINIDGVEHKGNYLMVEIMNTSSIGPKLNLAPLANPADGLFDIVMITEKQRDQFVKYVESKIEGREEVSFFNLLRAKRLHIFWDGTKAHVDDQVLSVEKGASIEVELLHGPLEFFAGENSGSDGKNDSR